MLAREMCFWISVLLIFQVYIGYPAGIHLRARFSRKRNRPGKITGSMTPSVTVLIPAHNEARWIALKIENTLELEYPCDRRQILVACDGCTDETVSIARRYCDRGVEVVNYQPRTGKTALLNHAVPGARGEIVLLTDANALLTPNTLSSLMWHFEDSDVGCATGEKLCLPTAGAATKGEGLYWRYEAWIKTSESALGSCLGSAGQVVAIRKTLFREIPVIGDDFYIPMRMLIADKAKVRFEPRAKALIPAAASLRLELERKVRSHVSLLRDLPYLKSGLNPLSSPIWWRFLSHHVLRLFVPFAMIAALAFCFSLWEAGPAYRIMAVVQCAFYAAGVAGFLLQRLGLRLAPVYLPFYFTFANLGVLLAWIRWARRKHQYAWQRTERTLPTSSASDKVRV